MDTVKTEWQAMIDNGRIPCIEFELINDEWLQVDIELGNHGLIFSFDSDGKQCFFDGAIETINGSRYLLPFDECYGLDRHLEMISENITEGFICANNLMPEEE
ncbi:MAG: hypothetical protein ACRDA8_00595 [Shewanella sp.]